MRGIYAIAGVGILGVCLASWAALAWAQQLPVLSKLPPTENQPAEVAPMAPTETGVPMPPAPTTPAPMPTPVRPSADVELPKPPPPAPVSPSPEPQPAPMLPPPAAPPTTPAPAPAPMGDLPGTGPAVPVPAPMPTPDPLPTPTPSPMPGGFQPAKPGQTLPTLQPTPTPRTPETPANTLPAHDERPSEPTVTPDNTTGRQEPAVSLEWIGPPTAKIGQATEYVLVVRNACNIPVQKVLVQVRIPNGMSVAATEPKAVSENNVLVWELGTLLAKQDKNLQMKLVPDQRGDVAPQAWVTFTGSSVMRIRVREPKLVLKAQGPEKVMVGDPAAISLTVSNPGDGPADKVRVHAVLSEGLEHARGSKVDFEIGDLAPGDSRSVTLICATKTGGVQKVDGVAEADGALLTRDAANVNVIMPRLDLQLVGPSLRYLDRKALYTLKVTNPGDAAATNVTVSDIVPAGFKVLAASDGGRHDFQTRTVSWFLGEIAPGQTREVKMEVQAINLGEHKHKAVAVGARGLKAESEHLTRIEGLSALLLEVVDTEDPIEVGGDTAYEIRITNTGSKTETDIKLVCTIPDKMEFKNAQGPVRYAPEGKTVVFEPIARLAPRADAIFRVNVKAMQPGDVRFKVQVTSTNLVEPVIKMESTRIYSDEPEVKPEIKATDYKPDVKPEAKKDQ